MFLVKIISHFYLFLVTNNSLIIRRNSAINCFKMLLFFSRVQIYPLSGPVEGGTLVTIEGSNLGLREEDVHDNVYIGDLPCDVHDYHVSVKIICRTAPARSGDSDVMFPVRVTTPAGTTISTVQYKYTVSCLMLVLQLQR